MALLELQGTQTRKRSQFGEEDRNIYLQTEELPLLKYPLENHPDGAEHSCTHCSRKISVTKASSLQSGQHISLRSQRTAGFGKPYRHYAIIKETILCVGNITTLRLIHCVKQKGKIKIYDSIESYDLTIHELCIIMFIHPRYSPEKIIQRTEQVLDECGAGKFAKYNLLACNCEHFVPLEYHPDGVENSCAYCSREIPVTNASSLQGGQHISLRSQSTAGFGKPYRHHAIVKETISCVGNSATLRLIHFEKQKGKIKIYDSIESYDLTINELCIIMYIHPRYSPEEIIQRAEQVLNECGEGKFAKYNLLTCNCEHFATWCVVGKEESFQVQTLRVVVENILKFVFGGNGMITKFLLKALFMSSPAMTSATVTPVGILAGSVLAYGIYCNYFTVSLCKQYLKDRAICISCLTKKLEMLRAQFSVHIGTSSLTFCVQRFVLPILTPATGIPLLVLLQLFLFTFH